MNERLLIFAVAATSIATVAIGLRIGAGDDLRAAIVIGAPPPREGGRIAWQVRTQDDDGHTRTRRDASDHGGRFARAASRARSTRARTSTASPRSRPTSPISIWGDRVELDVRDPNGAILARGVASWPSETTKPSIVEHAIVRASRLEGALRMHVAVVRAARSRRANPVACGSRPSRTARRRAIRRSRPRPIRARGRDAVGAAEGSALRARRRRSSSSRAVTRRRRAPREGRSRTRRRLVRRAPDRRGRDARPRAD